VTRTNPLLPPGRKAPETCPHQESNRVPREMQQCNCCGNHGGLQLLGWSPTVWGSDSHM